MNLRRIDFAGGWLDVPRFARPDAYIVNAAIRPARTDHLWEHGGGVGGSAWAAIAHNPEGRSPIEAELAIAGWQDAAVLLTGGLCVWRSGEWPVLVHRDPGGWVGPLVCEWTGRPHSTLGGEPLTTADLLERERPYAMIAEASKLAAEAVRRQDRAMLIEAVRLSYSAQLAEGMAQLDMPANAVAWKYLGSGHGGYALYMFDDRDLAELYCWLKGKRVLVEIVDE